MIFCRHKYKIERADKMPSAFEQMASHKVVHLKGSYDLFVKKIVYVMRCSKCQKLKIHTEVNPPE